MRQSKGQIELSRYDQERRARAQQDAKERAAFALAVRDWTAKWLSMAQKERLARAAESDRKRRTELQALRTAVKDRFFPSSEPSSLANSPAPQPAPLDQPHASAATALPRAVVTPAVAPRAEVHEPPAIVRPKVPEPPALMRPPIPKSFAVPAVALTPAAVASEPRSSQTIVSTGLAMSPPIVQDPPRRVMPRQAAGISSEEPLLDARATDPEELVFITRLPLVPPSPTTGIQPSSQSHGTSRQPARSENRGPLMTAGLSRSRAQPATSRDFRSSFPDLDEKLPQVPHRENIEQRSHQDRPAAAKATKPPTLPTRLERAASEKPTPPPAPSLLAGITAERVATRVPRRDSTEQVVQPKAQLPLPHSAPPHESDPESRAQELREIVFITRTPPSSPSSTTAAPKSTPAGAHASLRAQGKNQRTRRPQAVAQPLQRPRSSENAADAITFERARAPRD